MTEALDEEGDIIHQKKLEIVFADTANTLYQKH
jgi:methionyl-tRNA formyltransferase